MNTNTTDAWSHTGAVPEWTVTDRLRKARELTGLDQDDFAEKIGVSRGTVSNYERGCNTHKKSVMMTWAMGSGVPLQWLLTGETQDPHDPASQFRPTREYANLRATRTVHLHPVRVKEAA